jgi:hypothetical protein
MITITPPSRLTFWRLVLGFSAPLTGLAFYRVFSLAGNLGIALGASKAWLLFLFFLAGIVLLSAALLALTFTPRGESVLNWLEFADRLPALRRVAIFVFLITLVILPAIILHPYYGDLLHGQKTIRLLMALIISYLGTQALKIAFPCITWFFAFSTAIIFQVAVYNIALYLPDISFYPFSMGWSETSRFYYPSLFMAKSIYGQAYPWPILHPSLHLALVPPYWFNAPLWFHRFWQVVVRFLLVGLIAPALLYRLKINNKALNWTVGAWIFVYLFALPLYLHLAVPVFIMLWGFSAKDDRRTWGALILAAIWSGLSRLNWYPMPGILALALYLLETPYAKRGWRYLIKPALFFVIGTMLAFGAQRIYIALSGIPNASNFYTSLASNLLWYRLWPNEAYPLGVFFGILIFSMPLWLVIGLGVWKRHAEWHPLRLALLGLTMLVLFVGGIFVSMKIGGGTDLHNLDAYVVFLLIVSAYIFFNRHTPENGRPSSLVVFPWLMAVFLIALPIWFALPGSSGFWKYDAAEAQSTLAALQQKVNSVNAQGGEILFITQRQLISMHILTGVKLVPEYEREELMEMAMANNEIYLNTFDADLKRHRFAAIVVDELQTNMVDDQEAMNAENNAWTRYVAKRILCSYQLETLFAADRIAVYVPQEGAPHCP